MVEHIDKLPWNRSTFTGRLNYYARVTDPRLIFASNRTLNNAKDIVTAYRQGNALPHVTKKEAIRARVIYDSAFHPDTGAKMNILGRMSSQASCGTLLVGAVLAFYRSMPRLIVMQFIVQSFAANVNYTNRNAKSLITNWQIATAYVSATTGAAFTAVGLNSLLAGAPTLLKRWIPLGAMVVTNSINIPIMRQRELIDGIVVMDKDGNPLGKSRKAAIKGIGQVFVSRVFFLTPAMLVIPTIMEILERWPFFKRGLFFSVCIQAVLSGAFLTVTVPTACALFPQQCLRNLQANSSHSGVKMKVVISSDPFFCTDNSLGFDQLEATLQEEIKKKCNHSVDRVYFNKGL